jgi:hypothetical protein
LIDMVFECHVRDENVLFEMKPALYLFKYTYAVGLKFAALPPA